jgi:hypothetical protein
MTQGQSLPRRGSGGGPGLGSVAPHELPVPLRDAVAGQPVDLAGQIYESLLAPDARRASGSHYTPPELASEVVEHTLSPLLDDPDRLTVCDPALGCGAFLLAAGRFLSVALDEPPAVTVGRLWGMDRDPLAVEVARRSLAVWAGAPAPRLFVGDSLLGAWPWPAAGFAAVVGNPPFVGGSFLTGTLGADYRERLVRELAGGRRGNADLCAYFLLRAQQLLAPGGCCGLVTTNTIAEGATRRVGLDLAVERGATLYRAVRQRSWPGDASLQISLVWFRRGPAPVAPMLDGRPVPAITTRLAPAAGPAEPVRPRRLPANAGLAFCGTKIYGQGFLLTPEEAGEHLAADPRNAEVLRPYLSGDDLYGRPAADPSRWAIDFGERALDEAAAYGALFARVERLVKPERDRLLGRNTIGTQRARHWWRFGAPASGLYAALRGRERVLAKVLHSHTHAVTFVRTDWVFSHALGIFASDDPALLAVLQSSLHEQWALAHGSSLGAAPRYTPRAVFETFPLPPLNGELAARGAALEDHRRRLMHQWGLGLTRLTARVNDESDRTPEIAAWRELQVALDQAVARAYGWSRRLAHGFGPRGFGLAAAAAECALAALAERNRQLGDAGQLGLDLDLADPR